MFMTTPSPVDGLEITGAKSNRVTHGLLGRSWRLSVVERGPLRLSLQLIPSPSVDHICKTTDTSILVQNEAQRKDLDAPLMIVDRKQQAEEASFSSTCYSHNAPTGVMAGSVLFVTCIFALMSPSAGRDSHYKIPFSTDTSMSPSAGKDLHYKIPFSTGTWMSPSAGLDLHYKIPFSADTMMSPSTGRDLHYKIPFSADTAMSPSTGRDSHYKIPSSTDTLISKCRPGFALQDSILDSHFDVSKYRPGFALQDSILG